MRPQSFQLPEVGSQRLSKTMSRRREFRHSRESLDHDEHLVNAEEVMLLPEELHANYEQDRLLPEELTPDDHEGRITNDIRSEARNQSRLLHSKKLQRKGRWYSNALRCILALIILLLLTGVYWYNVKPKDEQSPPWYPPPSGGTLASWKNSYEKAAQLVNRMSLLEKVNVTTGVGWMMGLCVGNTGPAADLGFPSLCLQDGPLGVRFADQVTAFPAGITTGATWNGELMYIRGRMLGREARMKGVHVLLGPSMGPLGRMPGGGRVWEGFGSDPILQGVASSQTIRGIQEEGVMATAKHYVLNEQEHFRRPLEWGIPHALSSNIDDRTLHEFYLWPFAESVRAGVASVMCSYQMVNNSYSCSNSKLLNGILKDELGFQGFIQSDWLAQRSGVASALTGLDMTMPGDGFLWADGVSYWGSQLTMAVLNGSLPMSRLNDMVMRIVAAYYQLGQDDPMRFPPEGPNFSSWSKEKVGLMHPDSGSDGPRGVVNDYIDAQGSGADAHSHWVRKIGAEAIVLLKNEGGMLPLSRNGSSALVGGRKMRVAIIGEDAGPGKGPNHCAERQCNQGTLAVGWGSGTTDFPYLVTPESALRSGFNGDRVSVYSFLENHEPPAGALEEQDVCLVFANADAGEGVSLTNGMRGDRRDLNLQKGGDGIVQGVARRCGGGKGKTIVVIHSVGPVVVDKWIDLPGVKALLFAHLPGQESGNSLADITFGDANPSGKLPYTVGKSLKDYGKGGQIMYMPNGWVPQQNFGEGLYVDYRHFDKYEIEPRYEFGFGLSYTTFSFSNLSVSLLKHKSAFPSPRAAGISPPQLSESVPPASEALFPKGFIKLRKYVYPYIQRVSDVKHGKYPYPESYDVVQPPSPAGGGEGGNPSLYETFAEVRLFVTNTGTCTGKEVVQVYVAFPKGVRIGDADGDYSKSSGGNDLVDFPVKVLRSFEKLELQPGEKKEVMLGLTRKDLSFWSAKHQNWVMPTRGQFRIFVGNSSRSLPLSAPL